MSNILSKDAKKTLIQTNVCVMLYLPGKHGLLLWSHLLPGIVLRFTVVLATVHTNFLLSIGVWSALIECRLTFIFIKKILPIVICKNFYLRYLSRYTKYIPVTLIFVFVLMLKLTYHYLLNLCQITWETREYIPMITCVVCVVVEAEGRRHLLVHAVQDTAKELLRILLTAQLHTAGRRELRYEIFYIH